MFNNSFSGPISGSVIGEWTNLQTFDLASNAFTGPLPTEIGLIQTLYFDLDENGFTGQLPLEIGNITQVQQFFVAYNFFIGTIPESVAQWIDIEDIYFEQNNFVGHVPTSLCNATNLSTLVADCQEKLTCDCCTVCV